MTSRIYPGNYHKLLSSYQNESVVAQPGRQYFHRVGYGLITAAGGSSFPITIPSPDLRADDKPRADITSMVIPAGACVYKLGIRVPDMRKDRGIGTARSGLVGTNSNRLKFASALASITNGQIAATVLGTDTADLIVGSTTIAPAQSTIGVVTPVILSGALTMSIYTTTGVGVNPGSAISSTEPGGTPVIVEVAYYLEDDVPPAELISLPFLRET
jgi:hypothetical protein